jgi:Transmembrane secretion effector
MADNQLDNNDAPVSPSPWASLGYRDYRLLFLVSLFATTAQQMRQTQNLYQVYELSGSAFQLGLTGLAQGIPLFAFGLFGGTLADFFDRRKLLLITTGGNLLIAVVLGLFVNPDRRHTSLAYSARHGSDFRFEHRPQSDSHGDDLKARPPLPSYQCRVVELQRLSSVSFHRPHGRRTQSRMDERR